MLQRMAVSKIEEWGVDLFGIRSWPIGLLDELTMFPLTFVEFCLETGMQPALLDLARGASYSITRTPSAVRSTL